MKAEGITITKMFGMNVRYIVPIFQRHYVWERDPNWETLWESIQTVSDRYLKNSNVKPHFIGAFVLDKPIGQTGNIVARQVIDGQQRLTTLQVLFAALRDLSLKYEQNKVHEQVLEYINNSKAFVNEDHERFKVWPTDTDRRSFQDTIDAASPQAIKKLYGKQLKSSECLLPNAYLFFYDTISKWISDDGTGVEIKMQALWEVLKDKISLVTIDLENNDDPQVIFETLNATGTKLWPSDLVKNYIFHHAEVKSLPVRELHKKYWYDFDSDRNFWSLKIPIGRYKRPRIDVYLQFYLALTTKSDISVSRLFDHFKDYYKSLYSGQEVQADGTEATPEMVSTEKVNEVIEDCLKSIHDYGQIYKSFFDESAGNTRIRLFFHRLNLMDTTTVYPFLLELFKKCDEPVIAEIVSIIESFLTNRIICRLTTKNYNNLFLDLLKWVDKEGEISPQTVKDFLLKQEGDAGRWPTEEELETAWLTYPFYRNHSTKIKRMVLEAIDLAMENEKSEKIYIDDSLTIEHLMPRDWQKHWPIEENDPLNKISIKEKRDRLVHTPGNLTLLTQKLNSSISNGPWQKKRDEIVKQSKINMNREFLNVDSWDEEKIYERSKRMLEYVKKIWPRPINRNESQE